MILRKIRRRDHTLSYAVLSFLAFGIALPIVIGSRMDRLSFPGGVAFAAMRDKFSLSAPLPLIQSAGILLERGTVSIAKSQSAGARTSEGLLGLLASGNARLVLDDAEMVFTSAFDVSAVPPPIDAAAPIIATLLGSHFESLRINNGVVNIPSVGNGLLLRDVNADVSLRRKGAISARGTFKFRGKAVEFDISIGVGDRKSANRLPVTASLDGELLKASLEGRVTLGSGLQVSASSPRFETPNLRELAAWLGYSWPIERGFEKVRAEGNFDLADTSLSLQQATLNIDGNELTGALFVTFEKGHPTFDATLAARRLDLAPYMPAAKPRAGTSGGWSDVLETAALGGLPVLSRMDADLRLSAERVSIGSQTLGRGAATITAKQGRVIADVAEFEIEGGGAGALQLSLDASQPQSLNVPRGPAYTFRGKLRQLELSRLLPVPATGVPVLAGRGDLSLDLAGAGSSVDTILGSLAGKFGMTLPKGGEVGIDLSALMAMGQAAAVQGSSGQGGSGQGGTGQGSTGQGNAGLSGSGQPTQGAAGPPSVASAAGNAASAQPKAATGWRTAARGATTLDDLSVKFRLANGLWTIDHARARSGNAVFLGTGALYPPTLAADVVVSRVNALSSMVAPDAVTLPETAVATQSVQVRGPWASPQILPQSNQKSAEPRASDIEPGADPVPAPAPAKPDAVTVPGTPTPRVAPKQPGRG